jgi:hypothetical protein
MRRTEAGVWILRLDPFSPVLAEEHVCGEGTFGAILALFATLLLNGGLLLWDGERMSARERGGKNKMGGYMQGVRMERWRTLDLEVSLGIWKG